MKRTNLLLFLILGLFSLLSLSLAFFDRTIYWDSAVYSGMGKYYWSLGNSGFIEFQRPPLLPGLLGMGWKLGFDIILWGKILALAFSLGTIFLTFKIGKRLFDARVGLLAAFFSSSSITFLFFSRYSLTEMPSAFFLLLGILLLLESRFFLSGIAFGLCFLTRFFQAPSIAIIVLSFFFFLSKNNTWKNLGITLAGLFTAVLPYLTFVFFHTGNPLSPFFLQYFMTLHTGAIYSEPWWFYFPNLFRENASFLFLAALPFFIKQEHWDKKRSLLFLGIPFLALLFSYSLMPHKEMRILLPFLSPTFIVIGYCANKVLLLFLGKPSHLTLATWAVILGTISYSFSQVAPLYHIREPFPSNAKFFQDYLTDAGRETVWISDPRFALSSDKRISGLLYLPFIEGDPTIALINECNLEGNDRLYTKLTATNLAKVKKDLTVTYSSTENGCTYQIYQK